MSENPILLKSVRIFTNQKGEHNSELAYSKMDEVQHETSIYVASENIEAGVAITDERWVIKLDNRAAHAAEVTRASAEGTRQENEGTRQSNEEGRQALHTKWSNPVANVETLSSDSDATFEVIEGEESIGLNLGVPKGDSGVYIGAEVPTDPDKNIWLDPEASEEYATAYEQAELEGYIGSKAEFFADLGMTAQNKEGAQSAQTAAEAARDEAEGYRDASAGYAQQLAAGVASPAGVYPTLVALEAAFPTGDTHIYLVSAYGHWYYWNGSAWADGGVYMATDAGVFVEALTEADESWVI